MKSNKYHNLGNDYIEIDPKNLDVKLSDLKIKTICNRNYGVGFQHIHFVEAPILRLRLRPVVHKVFIKCR